jgi:hypothetical protein
MLDYFFVYDIVYKKWGKEETLVKIGIRYNVLIASSVRRRSINKVPYRKNRGRGGSRR